MKSNNKPIDLSKSLQDYTSGWVALDQKNKVIAHAKDFDVICKKVENRKDIFLVPASKDYFGSYIVG